MTGVVYAASLAWTVHCWKLMQVTGDFYWWSSIPSAILVLIGSAALVSLLPYALIKWFDLD